MSGHYREQLAALRQQRQETIRDDILDEMIALESQHAAAEQRAQAALARGDVASAEYELPELEYAEEKITEAHARLDVYDRQNMPADGLLPSEREYIQQNPEIANQPGVGQTAAWYSNYLVSLGYQRGTPEFIEGMRTVLEPQGYQPMMTPDDVVEHLNTESKYGKTLTADEYNANVERLLIEKQLGNRPDR